MEKIAFNHMDNKIFKYMLESLKYNGLYSHVIFVQGLYGVKSRESDLTMSQLLKGAEEVTRDDVFVEWAEKYTPYRYSSKKKRMVRSGPSVWRLQQAFDNPEFTSTEFLKEQVEKFGNISKNKAQESIDLDEFLEYVERRIGEIETLIHKRVAQNKIKSEALFENNEKEFNSLKEEEKRMIKEYLSRCPAPDTIGPMGTPQSKYRYGTFGLKSMVYDAWRRS